MTGAQIAGLLDEMRSDIRAARFDRLQGMAPELEAAMPDLATLDRDTLLAIGQQADEAMRQLAAMMQGVRAARRRLAEIAAADSAMTYDAHGTRTRLAAARKGPRV